MRITTSDLFSRLKLASSDESNLMGQGVLTKAYQNIMRAIAEGISEQHNNWQDNAIINSVTVFGGTCAPLGSISNAIGIATIGTIIGRMSGTGSYILTKVPNEEIPDIKKALKSYLKGIGDAFDNVFNNFLDTAIINNIEINGGLCTCQIVAGAPVPGTLIAADGDLASLDGNMIGIIPNKGLFKNEILGLFDSNVLANGSPTKALNSSIDAISSVLEEIISDWLVNTKVNELVASGGLTIPNSPVSGAIGTGGIFE